jgi:hypothetical protein
MSGPDPRQRSNGYITITSTYISIYLFLLLPIGAQGIREMLRFTSV